MTLREDWGPRWLCGSLLLLAVLFTTNRTFAQEESAAATATDAQAADTTAAEEPPAPEPLPAIGYVDSPLIPGTPWRVHDINRPRPRVVQVPEDAEVIAPPADAIVLFDGTDLSHWRKEGEKEGELFDAGWKIVDDYMEIVGGAGSIRSVDTFGDCQIHVEWSSPEQVKSSSQGRGNSGVIVMGRYEIQVLDSFQNPTYADGQASAIYGQYPPLVNATRAPGKWNVYDIIFSAPKFEDDKLVERAYATVFHNGVLVHYHRKLIGAVAHKRVGKYAPHSPAGPIQLQDHGNPVRYRNIWVRPLDLD